MRSVDEYSSYAFEVRKACNELFETNSAPGSGHMLQYSLLDGSRAPSTQEERPTPRTLGLMHSWEHLPQMYLQGKRASPLWSICLARANSRQARPPRPAPRSALRQGDTRHHCASLAMRRVDRL